jgi:hypothetical protein
VAGRALELWAKFAQYFQGGVSAQDFDVSCVHGDRLRQQDYEPNLYGPGERTKFHNCSLICGNKYVMICPNRQLGG